MEAQNRKKATKAKTPVKKNVTRPKVSNVSGSKTTKPKTHVVKKIAESAYKPASCTKTDISEKILNLVRKWHPTAKFLCLQCGSQYCFEFTDKNEVCPISKSTHDLCALTVTEDSRGYHMECDNIDCNGSLHLGYAEHSNELLRNGINIDQRYIVMEGKLKDDVVGKQIIKWAEDCNDKTLVARSAMGTGKTSMIEKLLRRYKQRFKKILWITHRQTLTRQLYGQFAKFGFVNYMDEEESLYAHDRLIVQIDSLARIKKHKGRGKFDVNGYDLIIIDEIEGNLNHYSSPFLEKGGQSARDTFDFMISCMNDTKKILLLDADVGPRTTALVSHIGPHIVINNNFKPICKTFVVNNDTRGFDNAILRDVKRKKNICVVSMSASYITGLAEILKTMGIRYTMHTSHTDDKLKLHLEDVNTHWTQYQVVLYSPCIESGVDFNVPHFDKIYAVIRNGQSTCSQRAFLQMIGRIRIVKNPVIQCLYNGPVALNNPVFTFEDALDHVRYYETMNGRKVIHNATHKKVIKETNEGRVITYEKVDTEISLFDIINIHNEVEQSNKNASIFMTILNRLVQLGGHKLEISFSKPSGKSLVAPLSQLLKQRMLELDERDDIYDLGSLVQRQKKNDLGDDEKLVLKKLFLIKTFRIKHTDNRELFTQFLDEFSDKVIRFKRFEDFFGYKEHTNAEKMLQNRITGDDPFDDIASCEDDHSASCEEDDHSASGEDNDESGKTDYYDNLSTAKKMLRNKIIIDILNRLLGANGLKYSSDDLIDLTIDSTLYRGRLDDVIHNSIYFKDEKKNRSLFSKSKEKVFVSDEQKKMHNSKTIQSLLDTCSIQLIRGKRSSSGGRLYDYSLSVDKQIKNIIDMKYGADIETNEYNGLFN